MTRSQSGPRTITSRVLPPLDIGTMRAAAEEVLDADDQLPRFDELAEVTQHLRAHLQRLVPVVEQLARQADDRGPWRDALETVAAAREALATGPGHGLVSAVRHAHSLARELQALCSHHETQVRAWVRKRTHERTPGAGAPPPDAVHLKGVI